MDREEKENKSIGIKSYRCFKVTHQKHKEEVSEIYEAYQ